MGQVYTFINDQYLVHPIRAVCGLDRSSELTARPDVPNDGLLDARKELSAVLQH